MVPMNHSHHHHQQQQQQHQPILCLNRLIEDLESLYQDHQSADVIFLVYETVANSNAIPGTTNEVVLYAHRLILRARCQNFRNVSTTTTTSTDLVCRPISGATIKLDGNTWVIQWPQINAQVLRSVLNYIYTSKIQLNDQQFDQEIFELLTIAYELGLDELISIGEQRINEIINVHNVCHYLDQAIRLRNQINENDSDRMIQICMQHISQAANDCIKTESFLNISKETMIYLLNSDQFALDEANIFRCTLEWAKHQTGVHKPTEHWTEEDRTRIQNQLTGVINHIRILLIDSQVFAKEVEPTGVVPIELILERYRFAALTITSGDVNQNQSIIHNDHEQTNKRLQPRIYVSRFFPESKLLSNHNIKYEHILNEWYGQVKQTWKLIFRASEHEFSAEAFHNCCDGIKPTYILVLSTKGYLSGGFSDVAWSHGHKGRGCYASSEYSYLFRLQSPCNQKPSTKYDVRKKMFAIGQMASKGPVFGAGADLLIADNCHLNEDSYTNMPHSYDGQDASIDALFGSYYFTVVDYEVFTLNSNTESLN